jgi:hypothetical protein
MRVRTEHRINPFEMTTTEPHEIHMFSAVAEAGAGCGFAHGERHPMLIFVRQPPGSAHDLAAAAAAANAAGWREVDITRAGTLPPDASDAMDPTVQAAYARAVDVGAGLTVFEAVVEAAPRKE